MANNHHHHHHHKMAAPIDIVGVSENQKFVCSIIPPLQYEKHKGQSGRVAVIGGSIEYTGAPFYAGMAAMKVGADLSYIFCAPEAALPIKCYSPELMVLPYLDYKLGAERICERLKNVHALVIGCGLGKREETFDVVSSVMKHARDANLPMVIDADAVFLVKNNPELIRGYRKAILTPNLNEAAQLATAVFGTPTPISAIDENKVQDLAQQLGNVTLMVKGPSDIITNGELLLRSSEQGSPRRCGGQGDLVAGSLGTFTHWAHQAASATPTIALPPTIIACLGASMLVRRCSRQAFKRLGRSMGASDMISEIRTAFQTLFPVD